MLNLKRMLTKILEYMNTQYVVETKSVAGTSVEGGGRTTVTIDVQKSGYTAIGIVGSTIWGTEVFAIGRLSFNSAHTQANVTIINTFTDARTPDSVELYILYRKS